MKHNTNLPMLPTFFAVLLSLTLFALPGCGKDDGDASRDDGSNTGGTSDRDSDPGQRISIDHSSPDALFASTVKAADAGDHAALMSAFHPAMQREMTVGMITMVPTAGMIPGADKQGMLAVLKEHGVAESELPKLGPTMQTDADALADRIQDQPGFIAAMMDKIPNAGSPASGMSGMYSGFAGKSMKLTNLEKQGDRASAQVSAAGQTSEEDRRIYFARIDQKWYLDTKDGR